MGAAASASDLSPGGSATTAVFTPSEPHNSKQYTREEIMQLRSVEGIVGNQALLSQVEALMGQTVQQSYNCCQMTALAYGFTALGFPTSVDDILWTVEVNCESVVGDGMTLAETHDAALRYVSRAKLPVFVECYHFDQHTVSDPEALWAACQMNEEGGNRDFCLFNFHSGMANGWKQGGGGHFAVFIGSLKETKELLVADVHPIKYGTYWSAPFEQVFRAMQDKDSAGRARGMLRLGILEAGLQRPLPSLAAAESLVDWTAPRPPYVSSNLARHIPLRWDGGLGCPNLCGLSALEHAMRVLDGEEKAKGLDELARGLKESLTWHLDVYQSAEQLHGIATRAKAAGLTSAVSSLELLSAGMAPLSAQSLRAALTKSRCGNSGVCVLVPYCMNAACGGEVLYVNRKTEAAALTKGSRAWGVIAAFDPNADDDDRHGVIMASAHNLLTQGRLWPCSMTRLAESINMVVRGSANEKIGSAMCAVVLSPPCDAPAVSPMTQNANVDQAVQLLNTKVAAADKLIKSLAFLLANAATDKDLEKFDPEVRELLKTAN